MVNLVRLLSFAIFVPYTNSTKAHLESHEKIKMIKIRKIDNWFLWVEILFIHYELLCLAMAIGRVDMRVA